MIDNWFSGLEDTKIHAITQKLRLAFKGTARPSRAPPWPWKKTDEDLSSR